jgi:hypothetical protein
MVAAPGQQDWQVFCQRSPEEWVAHNTCHELTHASTDHLRLPFWLHEGLAMRTVDRYAGRPTVRDDTVERYIAGDRQDSAIRRPQVTPAALVRRALRGYWTTRYLDDALPALLRQLLAGPPDTSMEDKVAAALGIPRAAFWPELETRIKDRYGRENREEGNLGPAT